MLQALIDFVVDWLYLSDFLRYGCKCYESALYINNESTTRQAKMLARLPVCFAEANRVARISRNWPS